MHNNTLSSKLYKVAIFPFCAGLLALLRYLWQGDSNLWTKLNVHLYLPDPDLGWRRSEETSAWLGLDIVLGLGGACVAAIVCVAILRRIDTRRNVPGWIATVLRVACASTLVLPLYFLATGSPPTDGRSTLPVLLSKQSKTTGINASLTGLPAGRYTVLEHPDAAIVVSVEAGGEAVDARFAGDLQGYWQADPQDLRAEMSGEISVSTKSVDTALELRDKHARDYLKAEDFPRISFRLGRVLGTSPGSDENSMAFQGTGDLQLMGKTMPVVLSGDLQVLSAQARTRLALDTGDLVLLKATFPLDLSATPITSEGSLFSSPNAVVQVTLFLQHSTESAK